MIVQTDIPCGNGRVQWLRPGVFEIEVIAYSKAPRYAYFRIADIESDRRQEIVLRPDSYFASTGFSYSPKGFIWLRTGSHPEWTQVPPEQIEVAPHAVRFHLDLKRGEEYFISTEPPREYAETNVELFGIAAQSPEFARVHCLGHSIEQRPIFLLRATSEQSALGDETLPVVTLLAGEHASEFAGEEIIRGMLSFATGPSAAARELRDSFTLDFILNANPDGNFHGWHQYNAKDWREHNYREIKDRSWHHEHEAFLMGQGGDFSPETKAIGGYIQKCAPVFLLNAHSWQGHQGNPGAFHADAALLDETTAPRMARIVEIAKQIARRHFGVEFETYPSSNLCTGHLDSYLLRTGQALALAIEGHMSMGREDLQRLGALLLEQWLSDPLILSRESLSAPTLAQSPFQFARS